MIEWQVGFLGLCFFLHLMQRRSVLYSLDYPSEEPLLLATPVLELSENVTPTLILFVSTECIPALGTQEGVAGFERVLVLGVLAVLLQQ